MLIEKNVITIYSFMRVNSKRDMSNVVAYNRYYARLNNFQKYDNTM